MRRFVSRAALVAALVLAHAAAAAPPRFDGPTIKNPAVPPDFALRDQAGHVVELDRLRGRVVALTFLYTHCRDVCPLTAERLNAALRSLGPARTRVRVLAVSVDPKGDTPRAVRRFVALHRLLPEFRYLIGPPRALGQIWREYGVSSVAKSGDRVDHTLYTLLLDRSLRGRVLFDSTAQPAEIAHDVSLLIATAGGSRG
jgi:protein SCO1/2